MKKYYTIILLLALILCGFSARSQKQIGADIDGEATADASGASVSLSADGTVVAIGATGNKGTGKNQAGHVRVYKYNTAGGTTKKWVQLGQDIDGEADKDNSGISVSLSDDGTIVAIGAYRNDGTNKKDAGHVRIYQYTAAGGTTKKWVQLGQDIDGEAAGDWFGSSVSLSADGKTVAIGAPRNGGKGAKAGHVRVYQYKTATGSTTKKWVQFGQDIDGEAAGDQAGESVSLSADGKTLAIGAPRNGGKGAKAGHVRVYQYTALPLSAAQAGGTGTSTTKKWIQLGKDIDGEAVNDESGWSVSLSADGKTVAIGAPRNSGSGFFVGHVRVYQYMGTTKKWTQLGQDIEGEAAVDESGRSVSLSADGKTVAIGAPRNAGSGVWAGHVRSYQYNTAFSGTGTTGTGTTGTGTTGTGTWTQLGKDIDGETLFNQSGKSVSLSDDGLTLAIGAPLNGGAKGHARVYDIPPVITSAATVSVAENTTNFSYTITANEKVTFALGTVGGDEALFKLADAKVRFKVAPDFENPKDADKNNVYKLELKATDAAKNKSTLLLSITVTNVDGVVISLPASLAFADTKVGKTAVKDLTISNTGDAALTVTKVTYPAGFTGDWSNGTIVVGGKRVVKVSFKPTEAKDYTGAITVESDARSGRNTLTVSGKGILITGIEPQAVFPGLSVFPNPAVDVLHVKLPNQTCAACGGTNPVDIQLVDVNGQVAYEGKAVTGDELSIDVSGYKTGVYVLVLQTRATGGSKVAEWRVMIQ